MYLCMAARVSLPVAKLSLSLRDRNQQVSALFVKIKGDLKKQPHLRV